MQNEQIYYERYRPQFHFTAKSNWLNDPNGCVYHNGEYHLFFQHNPYGLEWGNMTWGHAVSKNLVNWKQLPHALLPFDNGFIYSGSAVVDSMNLSGLGSAKNGPMIAAFTHAKKPFGQALASSSDNGCTWQYYASGKHVVPNQGIDETERDPKILWHNDSEKWIMLLWVRRGQVRFFTSGNLVQWTYASDFFAEGFYECPDFFQLAVDGSSHNMKWVLNDAGFNYWLGNFDGRKFEAETGPHRGDFGANFYAAQTWNNTGSRIVQIAWMDGGNYPGMPFNQQMTFPCELSLRTTKQGIRLCRTPVDEIQNLYSASESIKDFTLNAGEDLNIKLTGDLLDISMYFFISAETHFNIYLHGTVITCFNGTVQLLGSEASLLPDGDQIKLRLLVDRTSIELFGNNGELSMSSFFLSTEKNTNLRCKATGGSIHICSLEVHQLSSIWR